MFVIRCTFWMTLVVLLLPANGANDVFGQRDTAPSEIADLEVNARDTLKADDLDAPWQGPGDNG